MNRTRLLVGTAISAVAGSLLLASPALAAGTQAGSTITNNVTVQYQVGGIAQTQATASNTVTVDRKVDLVVARTDASARIVTPGSTAQAVSFTVTNTSNDTLDFQLTASQRADGESVDIFGNDSFDTTGGFTYYLDDGDGVFDAGDTLVTHLNALAPDSPPHPCRWRGPLPRQFGAVFGIACGFAAGRHRGAPSCPGQDNLVTCPNASTGSTASLGSATRTPGSNPGGIRGGRP